MDRTQEKRNTEFKFNAGITGPVIKLLPLLRYSLKMKKHNCYKKYQK